MKFGLSLHPYSVHRGLPQMFETVRRAEELGFDTASFGEHVIWPKSHTGVVDPTWYDCLVLATALAVQTQRIKVLFSVLVLPYHHPVRLAKALATLDVVSQGRIIVGAGIGWLETEFPPLGVPFNQRGARTDECLRAMKELWTSPNPTFQGRFVSFQDIEFEPRPFQKPHPPIWTGGYTRRALERAAEHGDGMHPGKRPFAQLTGDMAQLRDLLQRRGRHPDRFTLSYTLAFGREHPELARQYTVRGNTAGDAEGVLSDQPDQAMEELEAFARLGFSHLVVRFPASSPEELRDQMQRFQEDIARPFNASMTT